MLEIYFLRDIMYVFSVFGGEVFNGRLHFQASSNRVSFFCLFFFFGFRSGALLRDQTVKLLVVFFVVLLFQLLLLFFVIFFVLFVLFLLLLFVSFFAFDVVGDVIVSFLNYKIPIQHVQNLSHSKDKIKVRLFQFFALVWELKTTYH